MKAAWSRGEIAMFMRLTDQLIAKDLARLLGRSKAAIEGMRRKLKRLRELGVRSSAELVRLLGVCDVFVQHHSLEQIRRRARTGITVKPFLRPGLLYGRPHLVRAHSRKPQGMAS